jgi:hypothetical protein
VPGVRRIPSEYNMWLHTSIWGDRIEKMMDGFDPSSAGVRGESKSGKSHG